MRKPVMAVASITISALLAVAGAAPAGAAPGRAGALTLTWSVVHSPNRRAGGNFLNAVSCPSASVCMAAGYRRISDGSLVTLAESWNGTRWSLVRSPNLGRSNNQLTAVSCVSADACMAAGFTQGGPGGTLAESWNGTRWSVVHTPSPGSTGSDLTGVSCVSADACTAVGAAGNSSGAAIPLVESWDGTRWSVVPSPTPVSGGGGLNGVSCVTKGACMAVGCAGSNNTCSSTLAESWNGTRWSVLPSPSPGTAANRFNGVSCVSADACTAVGVTSGSNGVTASLIESWNGSRWSVVPSPNPGPGLTWLWGVSCAASDACNAAGLYFTSTGAPRTLIESWDGTRWTVVPTPNPGTINRTLNGISCASTTTCTAAGTYYNQSRAAFRTLIESGTASG
jgi:hypothetical protein